MKTLLEQGGGSSSMSAALQKRYQEMLNTQTEWVDLFTQPIFNQRFNVALIFTVEFSRGFRGERRREHFAGLQIRV